MLIKCQLNKDLIMLELWNYLKSCIFGNKLKLVDELIEIIENEEKKEKIQ